jgi:Ankyrin repeats (3 copies)
MDFNRNDNSGLTPLHLATKKGNVEMVKWLVEDKKVDFNAETLLDWAATFGDFEMVKWLVEGKEADVNATNEQGMTSLYVAENMSIVHNGASDTVPKINFIALGLKGALGNYGASDIHNWGDGSEHLCRPREIVLDLCDETSQRMFQRNDPPLIPIPSASGQKFMEIQSMWFLEVRIGFMYLLLIHAA